MIIILKIKELIYSKKRKLTHKILKTSILATSDKKGKSGFNLLLIFTKLLNFVKEDTNLFPVTNIHIVSNSQKGSPKYHPIEFLTQWTETP